MNFKTFSLEWWLASLLFLAIQALTLTLGWNLVIVALFYAAPISFWQSLIVWTAGRFLYRTLPLQK